MLVNSKMVVAMEKVPEIPLKTTKLILKNKKEYLVFQMEVNMMENSKMENMKDMVYIQM